MNCQELGRILDEQELRWLPAAPRRAAEAHLAGCPDCARAHQLDVRLAALPIPPLAPQSLAGWRAIPRSAAISRSGHARKRFIVVGVAAAFGVAAAILGWRINHGPEQRVAEPQAELAPAPARIAPVPARLAVTEQPPADVASGSAVAEPYKFAAFPANKPALPKHTAQVRLVMGTPIADAALQVAIEQSYSQFVNVLRAASRLTLVSRWQPADFRITYLAEDPRRPDHVWMTFIGVEAAERNQYPYMLADGRQMATTMSALTTTSLNAHFNADGFAMVYGFNSSARFEPGCVRRASPSQPEAVCSFIASSTSMAENVRLMGLPVDAALERQFQQRIADGSVPWQERYSAMRMLGGALQDKQRGEGLDEDFLRGALDLIDATPSALDRAVLWRTLESGLGRKGPVHLLIEAVRREPDERARLDAVKMLARNFPDDVQVRTALGDVADTDASELVRDAARQPAP